MNGYLPVIFKNKLCIKLYFLNFMYRLDKKEVPWRSVMDRSKYMQKFGDKQFMTYNFLL